MNMSNVSQFGVQELDAKEMIEIEGGAFIDWLKVAGAAIALAVALIAALD